MLSSVLFFVFIPLLAFILLGLTVLLGPHTPYTEKNSIYECGFSSFRDQNRTEFSISFFIFGLLFLLLDLEILLVYPYSVSSYNNSAFGLFFVIAFIVLLTVGFLYELARGALKIDSRQTGSGHLAHDTDYSDNKGLSKINLYPALQRRSYSTSRLMNKPLPGKSVGKLDTICSDDRAFIQRLVGLVDGEGNFDIRRLRLLKKQITIQIKYIFDLKFV